VANAAEMHGKRYMANASEQWSNPQPRDAFVAVEVDRWRYLSPKSNLPARPHPPQRDGTPRRERTIASARIALSAPAVAEPGKHGRAQCQTRLTSYRYRPGVPVPGLQGVKAP
jgi:hypothetical protein